MTQQFTGYAPGRVNLIGEHTDYNGGMVLPAALGVGLEVGLVPREDDTISISSSGYDEAAVRSLSEDVSGHWSDPCSGAIREAKRLGLLEGGASLSVRSTIPEGSGLSSSAALIVAILKAARSAAGEGPDDAKLALAARRVENDYMGVPCGIMDQMAVALAKPGTAMALDTKTLSWDILSLPEGYEFAVVHSGVTRKLTDGRYAARKVECDAAKAYFGTDDLCLLDRQLVETSDLDPVPKRRALHCLTEHERTKRAAEALRVGDVVQMCVMMNGSHVSMRDWFEMSLPAIDTLVASATELGALSARLTGGGFGGCIVACVESERREDWLSRLIQRHPEARFIDAAGPQGG